MSARDDAERALHGLGTSDAGLYAIGFALLDIADAIRESRAPHPTTTEHPAAEAVEGGSTNED